jgi:APA family basic amino acid/polyamine antiporter
MSAETGARNTPHFVRALGLPDCVFFVVGSMVGTGIFLSAGNVVRKVPHPGLILLVWVLGGVHALAAGFTYAELGARRPDAGGAYTYISETFGALPAFLYNWAFSFVIQPGSVAALSVGFAEFLGVFFPALGTQVPAFTVAGLKVSEGQLVALATSFAFTAWNILGIREGSRLNNVLTVVKIAALAAFVVFGLAAPAAHWPSFGAPVPAGLLASLGGAVAGVIWSYDGWINVASLGEEVKNPSRNLAGGLVIGILLVIVLYLAANVVYLCAAPPSILGASPRAAETASRILFGPRAAGWFSAAVLISILGSLSANIVPAPRVLYATARDGRLPKAFGRLHPRYSTPAFGLMFQALVGAALTLSGTFDQIVATVVSAGVVFYAAGGAAIFVYRRRQPDAPYRCPAYPFTPALYVGASLLFCAAVTVDAPLDAAKGLVILAAGVVVYAWQERRRAAA